MQTKYGKRKGMSFSDWIIKKRTLSIAAVIISRIAKTDFYELEMAIYFRNIPNQLYISDKLTILHGQSDHLSRRFRSLISERYSR